MNKGLTNSLQTLAHRIFDMATINDSRPPSELPEGFVPLLHPLPPLTNSPLPEDIKQLGGYLQRNVYEKHFKVITERARKGPQTLFILTGSPGIGKSLCYLYFGLRLIQEKLPKFIMMTTMGFDRKFFVWDFEQGKIYFYLPVHTTSVIGLLEDEKDAWLLLDGPNKDIKAQSTRLREGKTVWFLSPNAEIIGPLENKAKADVHYMPAWTLEELKLCNQHLYKLSNEDLCTRHDFFGGVPRYVFDENQEKMWAKVQEALDKSDIMDNPTALAGKDAFLDEFSHKLILVQPVGLYNYRLAFASPQIQVRVIQKFKQNASTKLREFICITKGKAILAVLRGKFF